MNRIHSLVSSLADLFVWAISGTMPADAKLPSFKVSMELDTRTTEGTQARKLSAFIKALESESSHDDKGDHLSCPYGAQTPHYYCEILGAEVNLDLIFYSELEAPFFEGAFHA